jgi:hypothetical protein
LFAKNQSSSQFLNEMIFSNCIFSASHKLSIAEAHIRFSFTIYVLDHIFEAFHNHINLVKSESEISPFLLQMSSCSTFSKSKALSAEIKLLILSTP